MKLVVCSLNIALPYLRPTTCPAKSPKVMEIEVPIPMAPRNAVGAISPRYRACTQRPMPVKIKYVIKAIFMRFEMQN